MTVSTLSPVRSTKPRPAGARSPVASFSELRDAVNGMGLLERQRGRYLLLVGGLLVGLGGAITGFVLLGDSWFQLLIAGALGILLTQFAFFAHEASHRQVLASGPANDRLGRVIANGVVGMSYQWWMSKHTRHHANPNQFGKDPDLEIDVVSFTPEDAAARRGVAALFTRRQGALFFPLLLLEGLNLHYHSVRSLLRRGPVEGRGLELGILAARLGLYVLVVFWALPLGMAFAFLGVQLAAFGLYMGAMFAPNHIGMPVVPREARLDFLRKQVLTSRNIRGGLPMSMLMGGLNYQVEHHLFPSMPRFSLARARRLVREYCRREDIPYTETGLLSAWARVVGYLDQVGRAAPDPFACPVASRYGRA